MGKAKHKERSEITGLTLRNKGKSCLKIAINWTYHTHNSTLMRPKLVKGTLKKSETLNVTMLHNEWTVDLVHTRVACDAFSTV